MNRRIMFVICFSLFLLGLADVSATDWEFKWTEPKCEKKTKWTAEYLSNFKEYYFTNTLSSHQIQNPFSISGNSYSECNNNTSKEPDNNPGPGSCDNKSARAFFFDRPHCFGRTDCTTTAVVEPKEDLIAYVENPNDKSFLSLGLPKTSASTSNEICHEGEVYTAVGKILKTTSGATSPSGGGKSSDNNSSSGNDESSGNDSSSGSDVISDGTTDNSNSSYSGSSYQTLENSNTGIGSYILYLVPIFIIGGAIALRKNSLHSR